MKDFILNTAKGKRFFTEIYGFVVGNNIPASIDFYTSFLRVEFKQNFVVDNDVMCAMMNFARRYDMLINISACCDYLNIDFSLD